MDSILKNYQDIRSICKLFINLSAKFLDGEHFFCGSFNRVLQKLISLGSKLIFSLSTRSEQKEQSESESTLLGNDSLDQNPNGRLSKMAILPKNEQNNPLMIKIKKEGSKANCINISDPKGIREKGTTVRYSPDLNILSSANSQNNEKSSNRKSSFDETHLLTIHLTDLPSS